MVVSHRRKRHREELRVSCLENLPNELRGVPCTMIEVAQRWLKYCCLGGQAPELRKLPNHCSGYGIARRVALSRFSSKWLFFGGRGIELLKRQKKKKARKELGTPHIVACINCDPRRNTPVPQRAREPRRYAGPPGLSLTLSSSVEGSLLA